MEMKGLLDGRGRGGWGRVEAVVDQGEEPWSRAKLLLSFGGWVLRGSVQVQGRAGLGWAGWRRWGNLATDRRAQSSCTGTYPGIAWC